MHMRRGGREGTFYAQSGQSERHAKINCSYRDERFELDISKVRESREKDCWASDPLLNRINEWKSSEKLTGLKEHISNEEWKKGRRVA